MSIVGPNVRVWTSRSPRNASLQETGTPVAYLTSIKARIQNPNAQEYAVLQPTLAFKEIYALVVSRGVDIQVGDVITKITELDGVTIWPRTDPPAAKITYAVRFARESSPYMLRNHTFIVEKIRSSGR